MGEERDKLIRRLGGTPPSAEHLADNDLMARRMKSYADEGRLPPEIQGLRGQALLVGYGTLLNRASMEKTVGSSALRKPFFPVIVTGYRRLFNLVPDYYQPSFRLRDEPVEVGAANIQVAPGERFNGLAVPVTEGELSALDERERFYQRVEVQVFSFPDEEPMGQAFAYSAPPDSPWVRMNDEALLPRWQDVVLAREGAYAVGGAFGRMYDATTFLAHGGTPLLNAYGQILGEMKETDGD